MDLENNNNMNFQPVNNGGFNNLFGNSNSMTFPMGMNQNMMNFNTNSNPFPSFQQLSSFQNNFLQSQQSSFNLFNQNMQNNFSNQSSNLFLFQNVQSPTVNTCNANPDPDDDPNDGEFNPNDVPEDESDDQDEEEDNQTPDEFGDYTEDPNFDLQDYLRFREQCPDPRADDE